MSVNYFSSLMEYDTRSKRTLVNIDCTFILCVCLFVWTVV